MDRFFLRRDLSLRNRHDVLVHLSAAHGIRTSENKGEGCNALARGRLLLSD